MRRKVTLFCALITGLAIVVLAACNRTAAVEDFSSAFVELRDEGTVAWSIRADGTVKAMLKSRDEKPITGSLSGKIATDDASLELKQAEGSSVLEGQGLKLGAALTRVKYDLVVEGKTWTGTMFVPAGGTADLVAGAKAAANIKLPEPKIGPHGGTLQVVGGDVLELVINSSTGELRVYPFDAQMKAVAAADRAIQVGIVTDAKADLVALSPDPAAAYFTGKLGLNVDPVEVTISVKGKGQAEAQCALVGFQPGVALAVGATAPRVKMLVKAEVAAPEGDVNVRADMKGVVAAGANLKSNVDLKAPDLKAPDLKLKGTVNAAPVQATAGANANAGVGTKAEAAAKTGVGLSAGVGAGVNAGAKAGAGTETKAVNTDAKTGKAGGKIQLKLP